MFFQVSVRQNGRVIEFAALGNSTAQEIQFQCVIKSTEAQSGSRPPTSAMSLS